MGPEEMGPGWCGYPSGVSLSALSFCSCSPPFEAGNEVDGELVDEVGVEMAGEAGDDFEGDFEGEVAGQYAVQQYGALAAGAV